MRAFERRSAREAAIMNVSYLGPLQRAWARARSILLSPFRLETWLVMGFAAFLSEWLSGGWGQSGLHRRAEWHGRAAEALAIFSHPVWGPLLIFVVAVGIVVALVFQWLGARGKFVFLDNVIHGRPAIAAPWARHARQGNSLFLWKLVIWVVAGLVIGSVLITTAGAALLALIGLHARVAMAPPIVMGVALVMILGLLFGFVVLLTDDFVVPLMYRDGVLVSAAWRRFLPLLRGQLGLFVLYGLFVLVLGVVVGAVVVAVGLATCCVGFLLLLIPYVGQVVLLPVLVTFRGLGPEFLAQFGPDYDVFATAARPVEGGAPPAFTPPSAPPAPPATPGTGPAA
jgi:hypothetical protein